MKGKIEDIKFRELFRQKLGNAEIIPDPTVSTKLMRRLGRREFLRFNPGRFNIYYLGGIVAAGIAAAVFLSSDSGRSNEKVPLTPESEVSKSVNDLMINVPAEQPVNQKSEIIIKNTSEPDNKGIVKQEVRSDLRNIKNSDNKNNNIPRPGATDSFSKENLFAEAFADNNNLKGKVKSKEAMFETSVMSGCVPLKVRFYNKSTSFDSCRWTFGDGGYSNEKEPEWIFDVDGEYKVILNIFRSDGSQAIVSTVITVHPKPVARFEISPENAVIPDDEIRFLNYSNDAVKYIWDFGDGNTSNLFEPLYRYDKFGNYNVRLVVYSEYGCSDSLVVLNAFAGSAYYINFPNAFIPNPGGPTGGYYSPKSDEASQVFHPVFSGVSDYQLRIFSKLGILIFESNDVNIGWDGYFKGQLSNSGVYIWKVRGNFRNGEQFIKMGDVTLLKSEIN